MVDVLLEMKSEEKIVRATETFRRRVGRFAKCHHLLYRPVQPREGYRFCGGREEVKCGVDSREVGPHHCWRSSYPDGEEWVMKAGVGFAHPRDPTWEIYRLAPSNMKIMYGVAWKNMDHIHRRYS